MAVPAKRLRHHAPPETRRAQILEAALTCFARKGYHAATMDDIVDASGLSKGSLYWHFRSKDEVFLALFDTFVEEIFATWTDAEHSTVSTLDLLRRPGDVIMDQLRLQAPLLRAWAEFVSHPAARARLAAAYQRSRKKLCGWIRRGIRRGELRPLPVEKVAAMLVGSVEGLLVQTIVDPTFDAPAQWPVVWDVVKRGIAK